MSKVGRWFAERREDRIRENFSKHASLVYKTVEQLEKLIGLWIDKEEFSQAFFEKIKNYEKDADNVRRELLTMLAESSVESDVKVYLARIARQADYIADWSLESARVLQILKEYKISNNLRSVVKNMMAKIKDTVGVSEKALHAMFRDLYEALDLCDKVERFEEDVDELYQRARIACIKECIDMPAIVSILLLSLLNSLENIADTCENTSDNIREYVVRRA